MSDQKMPPSGPIVSSTEPVTLLGGGATGARDLRDALSLAPTLVAADGGADTALASGLVPGAVIGDFDSLSAAARAQIDPQKLYEISEQNSTDFDKALRHITAPLVIAVGFTGGRLDHELAAFHTLVARAGQACIVLGGEDIVFHAPSAMTLDLAPGTRVSLFPMAEISGQSTGLRWPIDGLSFHPARKIGTSNEALGGPMTLNVDGAGLLVILPRTLLVPAAQALIAAQAAKGCV